TINRISRTGLSGENGSFAGVIVICISRNTASVNHLRRVASKRSAVKPAWRSLARQFLGSHACAVKSRHGTMRTYVRVLYATLYAIREHSRIRLTLRKRENGVLMFFQKRARFGLHAQ